MKYKRYSLALKLQIINYCLTYTLTNAVVGIENLEKKKTDYK